METRYDQLTPEQAKVALSYAAGNATDPLNSYYDYCQDFKYHNGASAQMGIMACGMICGNSPPC